MPYITVMAESLFADTLPQIKHHASSNKLMYDVILLIRVVRNGLLLTEDDRAILVDLFYQLIHIIRSFNA